MLPPFFHLENNAFYVDISAMPAASRPAQRQRIYLLGRGHPTCIANYNPPEARVRARALVLNSWADVLTAYEASDNPWDMTSAAIEPSAADLDLLRALAPGEGCYQRGYFAWVPTAADEELLLEAIRARPHATAYLERYSAYIGTRNRT